jgi:hypothetical protein
MRIIGNDRQREEVPVWNTVRGGVGGLAG